MKTTIALLVGLIMGLSVPQESQDMKIGAMFGIKVSEVNEMDQVMRAGFKAQGKDVTKLTGDDIRVFQLVGNLKDWCVTDSFGKQGGGNTLVTVLPDNVMEMRGTMDAPGGK